MVIKYAVFEPRSAVEARIDSNRFLLHYHNFSERALANLHRPRPLPRRRSIGNSSPATGWKRSAIIAGGKVVLLKHALNYNVQNLKMDIFESLPLIFCSQSLTSLKLCHGVNPSLAILPKSLHLPVLKSLHLECVKFTASDDHSTEPFSNCHVLNTLVLEDCSLYNDAQVLCISNSTLSSLTISGRGRQLYQIVGVISHQLFSELNLSLLEEVNIDVRLGPSKHGKSLMIMEWLQVVANVKILQFCLGALRKMLYELSDLISTGPQPPSFVRLESLKINKRYFSNTSEEKLNTLVKSFLQNSPMDRIDIISV
ncbi:hypothetical protein GYH30_024935 [Glycine max]|uniref:FBD domain-containing protein n=1 Tax=Glycine max TaxID=3847 RepID=A0A0R0I7Y3_SOYBN|nr:hypothetical protein GYH30_024935 [Glycine max]